MEMQINQEAASKGHRGVRKYVGPLTVAVQELDGWFSYTFAVENVNSKVKKCIDWSSNTVSIILTLFVARYHLPLQISEEQKEEDPPLQ